MSSIATKTKIFPSQYCPICLDTNCQGNGAQSTYEEEYAANVANVRNFDAATQDMMKPILLHGDKHWMCKGCLSTNPPRNLDDAGGENNMKCGICRVEYNRKGVHGDGPPAPVSERSVCLRIAKKFQSGFFTVFRQLHHEIQQEYTHRNANTWTIMINENFCETDTFHQLGAEWKLVMRKTMLVVLPLTQVENLAERTVLELCNWSVHQLGNADFDCGPYSVIQLKKCRCEDRLFILRTGWLLKSSHILSKFTMFVIQHFCKVFFQYLAHLRLHERDDESISKLGDFYNKDVQSKLRVGKIAAREGAYGWEQFLRQNPNHNNVVLFIEYHPGGNLLPRLAEFSVAALLAFWQFLGDVTGDCKDPFYVPGSSYEDMTRWGRPQQLIGN